MKKNSNELTEVLKMVGNNIRMIREKANEDITNVSAGTGIPVKTLLEIEAGDSSKKQFGNFLIICQFFKIDFSRLLVSVEDN